jgi:hypothetical protein
VELYLEVLGWNLDCLQVILTEILCSSTQTVQSNDRIVADFGVRF